MPKKAAATAHPAKRARAKPPQVFDAGLHSCDRGMRFIYANPVESQAAHDHQLHHGEEGRQRHAQEAAALPTAGPGLGVGVGGDL